MRARAAPVVESRGIEPRSCLRSSELRYGDATASVAEYCWAVRFHGTYHLVLARNEETAG